jgi:hypothetical protein
MPRFRVAVVAFLIDKFVGSKSPYFDIVSIPHFNLISRTIQAGSNTSSPFQSRREHGVNRGAATPPPEHDQGLAQVVQIPARFKKCAEGPC